MMKDTTTLPLELPIQCCLPIRAQRRGDIVKHNASVTYQLFSSDVSKEASRSRTDEPLESELAHPDNAPKIATGQTAPHAQRDRSDNAYSQFEDKRA